MKTSHAGSNNFFPLAPGLISALNCLRQAYDCAQETRQSVWEFAVELENLESAGLSHTDSRWLIGKGYVEHAVETTRPTAKKRHFRPVGSTALPTRTCLVLTSAGAEFYDQTLGGLPAVSINSTSEDQPPINNTQTNSFSVSSLDNQSREQSREANKDKNPSQSSQTGAREITSPIGKSRRVPVWDARLHELRLGDRVIKRFIRPAPAQETILSVFQEEGWPSAIEDPLPMNRIVTKRRLAQTVRNLNRYSNSLGGASVYASRPPTAWPQANDPNVVPTPDPQEEFDHIAAQLYGTASPPAGAQPDMSGFLADYATTAGAATAGQIMQSFGPQEAGVINGLARNFAVCDRWFASVPAQTWPNRGFVHAGSSDGHINNDNYEVYDIPTIFNVLEAQGHSWGIFHDTTLIPSLTRGQFLPQLLAYGDHSNQYKIFKTLCQADANAPAERKLPRYSFVEPRFVAELGLFKIDYPSDYHPPHDVCRGEIFLADVYAAVRGSPYRDKILLVITFDEHGGCYDHVPPPAGAAAPDPWPASRDGRFDFSRYGVRVPAIVISSYVQPGTVFRASPGEAPYDHTSILATLRDWLSLASDSTHPFLPSPRTLAAPTLDRVLTLSEISKNTAWPDIASQWAAGATDESLQTPLNDVQKSLIATTLRMNRARAAQPLAAPTAAAQAKSLGTYEDAINFLHPDAP